MAVCAGIAVPAATGVPQACPEPLKTLAALQVTSGTGTQPVRANHPATHQGEECGWV